MKKLLVGFIVLAFAAPLSSFAINKLERTGKIEKDETGGYSETQKDYHQRRTKQIDEKTKGGYYQGEYHNESPEFRPGEWQFVDSGKGSTSTHTKKHKKVKQTEKETATKQKSEEKK